MTILSGRWVLTAVHLDSAWRQGVRIAGSTAADGLHEMVVGTAIGPVEGSFVEVRPYALNPETQEWQASTEKEVISWDAAKGVVKIVYADDTPPDPDYDFNDLIVECTTLDDELRPPELQQPVLDLTIPEQAIGQRRPDAPWWNR